ncbi:MAG: glycosyltransferase family 2 protein [Deltaproteobacteria bacterium]|nr:glycosyltransferase family 2 protein [Deltaproteobacteria bacterium]
MSPLSVVIIACNEADRIGDAIRSVAFAHEVVVLDSGSTDGTPEVARGLGARVVRTDWPGHVAQKNRALAEAAHPWVLALDADERVGAPLAEAIRRVLAEDPPVEGFHVCRRNHWLGRPLVGGGWYPDRRLRLVRRGRGRWVGEDPHDRLEVPGPTASLHGDLEHHPYRDLGEHLSTLDRYSATWAAGTNRRAHWWDLAVRPPWRFVRGYLLQGGYRDGTRGLVVASLGALYTLLKWSRRWMEQQEQGATIRSGPATDRRVESEGRPRRRAMDMDP